MFKKLPSILVAIIITLIFLLPYITLTRVETEKEIQRNKYIASQKINDISQKLIEELNKSLEYVEVLDIIVKNNPNNPEIMKTYSDMILKKHHIIQNIAIAPDGIVKYINPIETNQEALGHDLINDPQRYPFIKKAIDEEIAVMQGPLEAIQGGVLIFNRKAVFINENGKKTFWGLCVISIDFEKLVTYCGINKDNEDYYLALKVPKTDGVNDFIWGDTECFTKESRVNTLNFGDQVWEVLIYPKSGWANIGENSFALKAADILYVLLSLILFVFVLWHLNRYDKREIESKTDTMTGALNKNAFSKQVIKKLRNKRVIQGIIVIDIDNFKSINDTYGHLTGDGIITELANRLKKVLRNHDLLSRWGGDEFTIYINGLSAKSDIDKILKRIYHEVENPFNVDGVSIKVGISLGYAIYPDDGSNYEELYKKADIMMYSNKPVKEENE